MTHQMNTRGNMRHGLTTGQLPPGAGYIKRLTNELRTHLERVVIDSHGEVSLYHAAVIQTACRWERHSLLAQRWLRHKAETMDAATYLAFSRDIARASAERDKCLERLGLAKSKEDDVLARLYGPDVLPVLPSAEEPAKDTAQPADAAPADAPNESPGAAQDTPSTDEPTEPEPPQGASAEGQVSR